jgi:hypothetical protein
VEPGQIVAAMPIHGAYGIRLPSATRGGSGASWPRRRGGRQPCAELHHGVSDDASLRQGPIGTARADSRRRRRGRLGAPAARASRGARDVWHLCATRRGGRIWHGRRPHRLSE